MCIEKENKQTNQTNNNNNNTKIQQNQKNDFFYQSELKVVQCQMDGKKEEYSFIIYGNTPQSESISGLFVFFIRFVT